MQFAYQADLLAVQLDRGAAARVQRRMLGFGETQLARSEQRLQVGLDVEEIDGAGRQAPLLVRRRTVGDRGHALGLIVAGHGQRTVLDVAIALEHGADFEGAHATGLAVEVVAHIGDQAADQARTHHAQLAGNRVLQADRRIVAGEILLPGAFDEAHIDHFLVTQVGQLMANREQRTGIFRRDQHGARRHRRVGRDVLEAIHARHFLDQVFLDLDVEAVRRRRHQESALAAGELQAQAGEDVGDQLIGQRHADDFLGARSAQLHRLALRQVDDLVVDRTNLGLGGAANLDDQGGDALDMVGNGRIVDAALEAVRRVGREVVAAGTSLDGVRPPEGRFQVDVGRVQRHGGGIAAHDAGQRFDLFLVGDYANPVVELDGIAVQELERFALLAPAYVEGTVDLGQVKHVRRTADFQHYIIRDVDQGRHRALAAAFQAALHPFRRGGARVQAADDAAGETAAQVRRRNLDGQDFVAGDRHGARRRQAQRRAGERGHFARHAQHRQAVGLVRGQLDREFQVVQAQVIADVLADRRIFRQFHQAITLFRDAQLLGGAHHALRLDAAQLAGLDFERLAVGARRQQRAGLGADRLHARAHVRRAAHDVQQGAGAGIDLAHVQAVGVRVLDHFLDFGHHHVGERRRNRFDLFHFQAGHGQQVGQLIRAHLRIDDGTEPVF